MALGRVGREVLEKFWIQNFRTETVHQRRSCPPWSNTSDCRRIGTIVGHDLVAIARPMQQKIGSRRRGSVSTKPIGGPKASGDCGPRFQLVFPRFMHFPGGTSPNDSTLFLAWG